MKKRFILCFLSTLPLSIAAADDYSAWQAAHPEWELVFGDDFEGTELNSDNWRRFKYNEGSTSSDWFRYQSTDEELVQMNGDGTVSLWGKYGDYTSANDAMGVNDTYACGGLTTKNIFSFQYGYVEVRARFDNVQGTWPSIWMMPTTTGSWPKNGEIDIMEHLNNEQLAHQTLHSFNETANKDQTHGPNPLPTLTDPTGWHTYGLLWQEGSITFFIDGQQTYSTDQFNLRWPFDNPNNEFYINIDQQIGGSWVEGNSAKGIDQNTLSTTGAAFDIDYVRVYSYTDDAMDLTKGETTVWSGTGAKTSLNDLVLNVAKSNSTEVARLRVDESAYVQDLQVKGGNVQLDVDDGDTLRIREIKLDNSTNLAIDGTAQLEKLTGSGTISLTSNGSALSTITASESTFTGTLEIKLGTQHVLLKNSATLSDIPTAETNTIRGAKQFFTGSTYANLVVNGTDGAKELVIDNQYIHDYALNIGSLSGNSSAIISGKNGVNAQEAYRYLSIHQNASTTFEGTFVDSGVSGKAYNRSVGIIKSGSGILTLTGQNTSTANLEINEGSVRLDGGKWTGDIIVARGSNLFAKNGACAGAGVTLNGTLCLEGTAETALNADGTGNPFRVTGDLNFGSGSSLHLGYLNLKGLEAGTTFTLIHAGSITNSPVGKYISGPSLDSDKEYVLSGTDTTIALSIFRKALNVSAGGKHNWSSLHATSKDFTVTTTQGDSAGVLAMDTAATLNKLTVKGGGDLKISSSSSASLTAATISVETGATLEMDENVTFNSLAGTGTIVFSPGADHAKMQANESSFHGIIQINLADKCFIAGNASTVSISSDYIQGVKPAFSPYAGKYASVNINGSEGGTGEFIVDYSFVHRNALRIGNLSGNEFAKISGKFDANAEDNFRYISVMQDTDDVFSGAFIESGTRTTSYNRSVGLIKNGTANLTLTGENTSTANLEVEAGTLTLKDGGSWAGGVTVNGGTLATDGEAYAGANVTIDSNGKLAFVSADSLLNVTGDLTFNSGAKIDLTQIDVSDVSGTQDLLLASASGIAGLDAANILGPNGLPNSMTWSLAVKTAADLGLAMFDLTPTLGEYLVLSIIGDPLTATIVNSSFADSTLTLTIAETWAQLGLTGDLLLTVDGDLWHTIVAQLAEQGGIYRYADILVLDADGSAWAGGLYLNGYAGEADGTYFIAFIPEPATGTLSVLALAALVTRRRRAKGAGAI